MSPIYTGTQLDVLTDPALSRPACRRQTCRSARRCKHRQSRLCLRAGSRPSGFNLWNGSAGEFVVRQSSLGKRTGDLALFRLVHLRYRQQPKPVSAIKPAGPHTQLVRYASSSAGRCFGPARARHQSARLTCDADKIFNQHGVGSGAAHLKAAGWKSPLDTYRCASRFAVLSSQAETRRLVRRPCLASNRARKRSAACRRPHACHHVLRAARVWRTAAMRACRVIRLGVRGQAERLVQKLVSLT